MKNFTIREMIILMLSLMRCTFGEETISIEKSYQVPPVAVINDAQGLQYYATAPVYTAIPTVLIPNTQQLGLPATPIASVVVPPSTEQKPAEEFHETSTSDYDPLKSNFAAAHYYKPKSRTPNHLSKRPMSYINSLYGHPVRMKPLSSVAPSNKKVTTFTIQPSIDLSNHYNQEAASNLHPSTVGPPVVSTYGPAKAVELQHKTRLPGISGQAVYHRLKGPSHRHSYYPSKKMRVYSHYHKDHVHSHHFPSKPTVSVYKPYSYKYSGPSYLPPVPSTPSTILETRPVQENSPSYAYETGNHVKFPEAEAEVQKQNNSPGIVTQAIIKNQGVINNYDASLPLKVPSKKPYQFEVNEILKNSDLHFVQETSQNRQNPQVIQFSQKLPYQNSFFFNPPIYSSVAPSVLPAATPLDIYSIPETNTYQTNHIIPDQDLGTSETVKFPVAIIRGAHNIVGQGMYGITMKRHDDISGGKAKKTFIPSRRTTDWIPMSGSGVPLLQDNEGTGKSIPTPIETFNEKYIPGSGISSKKDTKVRQHVGDIISGKIPEEFVIKELSSSASSFSSERERRKGSVIDVYPSSGSEISKIGDTSDLVVSSVIKFS